MKYTYLLVNLGAILIPFIYSFHPKLRFDKKWFAFFPATVLSALPFLIWDEFFTRWEIWGFNPDYLIGVYIGTLPLEEIMFFFCIPYACVFTWHSLSVMKFNKKPAAFKRSYYPIILSSSLLIAIAFYPQLYTRYTFVGLGLLMLLLWYKNTQWFGNFLKCYGILLIPFLIVNGTLTGTGVDKPIVWYNDLHNFGIRILSIPIEDVFYGMSLILLNVILFEQFKKKKTVIIN